MFRLLRPKRIPSVASRGFRTTARVPHPDIVVVHKARVTRPRLWRVKYAIGLCPIHCPRLASGFVFFYFGYAIWHAFVLDPFVHELSDALESAGILGDDDEKDEEGDGDNGDDDDEGGINLPVALSLPLPFMIRNVPSPPFRMTDPEVKRWQSIMRDPYHRHHIKHTLHRKIQAGVAGQRSLAELGKLKSVETPSLYADLPASPPPKVMQLYLTSRGLKEKEIDSEYARRLRRVLWPVELTKATFAFGKTLGTQAFNDVRVALGYPPLVTTPERAGVMSRPPGPPLRRGLPAPPQANSKSTAAGESGPVSPPKAQAQGQKTTESTASSSAGGPPPDRPPLPPLVRYFHDRAQPSWRAFLASLVQNWRQFSGYPPRGSLFVHGLVKLNYAKAVIHADVKALYDPDTKDFVPGSIELNSRGRFSPPPPWTPLPRTK